MTLEEAQAILRNHERGLFGEPDARVQRLIGEANRVVQRAEMWGSPRGHKQRRRWAIFAIAFGVWVIVTAVALIVPLIIAAYSVPAK